MTIAYGIALSLDWSNPMWAGFTVAFISLSTSGQSFNKSAMRMVGAFVAVTAALSLIALFPQDRWLFMVALSVFVGFCTYMMGSDKYQYFWFSSGYVCLIVALEAGPNSIAAFQIAILRVQETGLGILVYSLVTVLLWRRNSVDHFNAAVVQLHSTQQQLYRSYFSLMNGHGDARKPGDLVTQEAQQLAQFTILLPGAESDSYEIKALNQQWRRYQSQLNELSNILERWHDSYTTIHELDYQQLMPNLVGFDHEIEQRFVQIKRMLDGDAPAHQPQSIELQMDKAALGKLSAIQKAALLTTDTNLRQLDQVTRSLFNSIADIKGVSQATCEPGNEAQASTAGFSFDTERLASILQVMSTIWLAYIVFIYVEDIPGGIVMVVFAGVLAMPLSAYPQIRVSSVVMPLMSSLVFCGLLYTFIMPHLSSFFGLGIMIFIVTFIICYLYDSPQKALSRAAGLSAFVTITSIENTQTYNILSVFDTTVMFAIIFIVLFVTAHIPFSPRPEQAFLRLLNRYFRSSSYLVANAPIGRQAPLSFWEKKRINFHLHDIKTLPGKIKIRSQFINTEALSGTSKEQMQMIISDLQKINIRFGLLLELEMGTPSRVLIDEFLAESLVWQISLKEAFQQLSRHHVVETQAALRNKLADIAKHTESRVEAILDGNGDDQLSRADQERFYQALGAYQGLSAALLDYSGNARHIDWAEWHESRL